VGAIEPPLPFLGIAGGFSAASNFELTSIDVAALQTLPGNLTIRSTLVTALSLPNLTSVGGEVAVGDNDFALSISLPALVSVGASVDVADSARLVDFVVGDG